MVENDTKSGNVIRFTVYLHPDELAAVEEAAKQRRLSKAAVIREAVRAHLGVED